MQISEQQNLAEIFVGDKSLLNVGRQLQVSLTLEKGEEREGEGERERRRQNRRSRTYTTICKALWSQED